MSWPGAYSPLGCVQVILHFYDGRWLLTGAKPSDDNFVSGLLCCRAALLLDET
jgi:hypothetical protein